MKNLKSVWLGIKLGLKMPSLPDNVNKYHNNPLTRIFRVLGGISILLLLSGSTVAKQSILSYIIVPMAFLQFIYIIVINLIKFIYIIYLWINNKFQVRNSPLDRIATFSANLIGCIKGTCVLGLSGGTALGMGLGIDELLIQHGREPIFRNVLGQGLDKGLNTLGFENPNKDITNIDGNIKSLKYRYTRLSDLNKDIDELDLLAKESGVKDSELIKEIKQDIKIRIDEEKSAINKSGSKILSELSKKNPFDKNNK